MQHDIPLKVLFQSLGTGLTERLAGAAPVERLNHGERDTFHTMPPA